MASLTVFVYDGEDISKYDGVTVAVSQADETTTIQRGDDDRESVDGTICGAKPAPKVWIKPVYEGPVEQYENVEYLMTFPGHIRVVIKDGQTHYSGGRILRVAVD